VSNRKLIKTGAGKMAKAAKIVPPQDGRIESVAVLTINSFMDNVIRKLNGFLSFGDGSQSSSAGNIYGQYIEFTTPSAINTEFQVDHGLNKSVFARLIVRQDAAAHLYDSNLGGWGANSVYFKCDTASVLFKILLLADPGTS